MKIATVIFTYNRSVHIRKVLEALKKNDTLPGKLILFQDGLKNELHCDEWKRVNQVIKAIDWCDSEVVVSNYNKGLADSVVDGLNYVFKYFDAAIVLEDDCVTHPQFMSYMTDSLEKYNDNKNVYSIGGYGWPVDVKDNGADAYFTQRISSWGWGTWKDRWSYYKRDYRILSRIKKSAASEKRFHSWGEDLEGHLMGNVSGIYDSWAVFWALTVIERDGYCLAPYQSLIDNIGFDGTGVHCQKKKTDIRLREKSNRERLILPDKIEVPIGARENFERYFSWTAPAEKMSCYNKILAGWIQKMQEGKSIGDDLLKRGIKKLSIWGKGRICDLLLHELKDKVEVLSIIESKPKEEYYNKIPIVQIEDLQKECQLIIVIPVYDMKQILFQVDSQCKKDVVGIDELIGIEIQRGM